MPIYDYRCTNCGREFEVILRSTTEKPDGCCWCSSEELTRVPSVPAPAQFKGSGFYQTDYVRRKAVA